MPSRVKQVLQWMPVDAETLIVADGLFEVLRSLGEKSPFLELVRACARPRNTTAQRLASGSSAGAQDAARRARRADASRRLTDSG